MLFLKAVFLTLLIPIAITNAFTPAIAQRAKDALMMDSPGTLRAPGPPNVILQDSAVLMQHLEFPAIPILLLRPGRWRFGFPLRPHRGTHDHATFKTATKTAHRVGSQQGNSWTVDPHGGQFTVELENHAFQFQGIPGIDSTEIEILPSPGRGPLDFVQIFIDSENAYDLCFVERLNPVDEQVAADGDYNINKRFQEYSLLHPGRLLGHQGNPFFYTNSKVSFWYKQLYSCTSQSLLAARAAGQRDVRGDKRFAQNRGPRGHQAEDEDPDDFYFDDGLSSLK